jgi:hypothetical protein
MLQLHNLRRRSTRLENLSRGLAVEASLLRQGNDPLLYRKRRASLKGMREAPAGLELARVTPAGAVRRMEGP